MARRAVWVAWVVAVASGSVAAYGGGFELHWPSARAGGMGGACIATLVDPSAIACNPGALALMAKPKGAAVGFSMGKFNESLYQGLPPGAGAGTAAEQDTPLNTIPHVYGTLPVHPKVVMGTGIYFPYRTHTEWADGDQFSGRFLANQSEVNSFDLSTVFATKIGPNIGVGAGFIYRSSDVSATRHVAANLAGQQRDIATLTMKTDTERALGWTTGLLVQLSPRFSFGGSYETAIDTEYNGVGTLTQVSTGDTQLDQLVAATFPFGDDLAVSSRLKFPSQTSFGLAYSPSKRWLFALDASKTQWTKSNDLEFRFISEPSLDTTYRFTYEDTWAYRMGARMKFASGPQLRVGYALDKSPIPDAAVGPFLPDADKTTLTAGFGLDWLDVAVGWTTYKQRIVTTNAENFNGNYRANSWIFLLTATK